MADIFISYARTDRDRVRGVIPILEAQGWTVFWDPAIEPGRRWDDLIASELEGARCVIVAWSQSSVLSNWVKDEATLGRERDVLVPVSIDGARSPLGFRHIQVETIDDWAAPANAAAVQRFLAGVRRVIGAVGEREQISDAQAFSDARYDFTGGPGSLALQAAPDGSVTVDYITECGRSREAAAGIGHVLARPSIAIDRATSVAAGNLLIIGINEPHPRPTLDHYERTFVTPYAGPRSAQSPPGALFALPGYHRSESGIAHFETLFCAARSRASRGTGLTFGGWSTHQREKFFAIALPHGWWLWGVDIRYGQPLEAKQFNYFTVIAENFTDQSKVMLFTPHENWLRSDFDDWAEQANLQKIIAIVEASVARVAAIITGGDHEYAHAATDTSVQIFEIGGGRRFVEPSHLEPRRTLLRWWSRNSANGAGSPSQKTAGLPPPAQRRDRNAYDKALEFWILAGRSARSARLVARLAVANVINAASRPPPELDASALSGERQSAGVGARLLQYFPKRRQSARLALGNLLFPFANPSLALAIGLAYWFVTWQF